MKYLIIVIFSVIGIFYLDFRYNKELNNAYEFNRFVLSQYCQPNILHEKQ